jgi:hypothetical protein
MHDQLHESPEQFTKYRSGIPRSVELIVFKYLEKERARCWQSARQLTGAIDDALGSRDSIVRRVMKRVLR